ncbi:MAG: hypothetical protein GX595_01215 [Lentisphaerae bacterium]|nr:hypothetical protein [Lentisphaerota bacterium]
MADTGTLTQRTEDDLVAAARAAVTQAFLSREGGTRYGAAALTRSGRVFTSGQYSSYNHVTNVHAEQAVLVKAASAGDADVVALAVASTSDQDLTVPCGVCRQVMLEHASRTGRDFVVLLACRDQGHRRRLVSELLPEAWTATSQRRAGPSLAGQEVRTGLPAQAAAPGVHPIETGAHVCIGESTWAFVHDPAPCPGRVLAKVKYVPHDAAPGQWRKIAHAFAEASRYEPDLEELGLARPAPWGGMTHLYHTHECRAVLPCLPVHDTAAEICPEFAAVLAEAGLGHDALRVTGSRGLGLARAGSDWDVVVRALPGQIATLREAIGAAITAGRCRVPSSSTTWSLLGRLLPGGAERLLTECRFADTFQAGDVKIALIMVPPNESDAVPIMGPDAYPLGRHACHGVVVAADQAPYKRACWSVADEVSGGVLNVATLHKAANVLRAGDRVSASGWRLRSAAGETLVQISPLTEPIVWHA